MKTSICRELVSIFSHESISSMQNCACLLLMEEQLEKQHIEKLSSLGLIVLCVCVGLSQEKQNVCVGGGGDRGNIIDKQNSGLLCRILWQLLFTMYNNLLQDFI